MDRPTKTSELSADHSFLSRPERLGALQGGNETVTSFDPLVPAVASMASGGQAKVRERRRGARLKCEGRVAFRTEGIDMQTWATFTDISVGGCYVELAATLPIRTPVNMLLDVKGVHLEVKGTVRTSYPLVGMGIEFTGVTDRERLGLEEILRRLEGDFAQPELPAAVSPTLLIVDAAAALNAVASFFQHSQSLTREQFAELMGSLMAGSRDGNLDIPR
jgi:hypothetical protein